MLPEIEQLLILQDRDQKLKSLKTELNLAPQQRADLDERLAQATANRDTIKQRQRDAELEKKKLEGDAKAKRDSIGKFKLQQFQTRKNEEFQALGNEIKRYEGDIEKIEDRELELMEELENGKLTVSGAEKEFTATKAQIEQQQVDLQAKIKALETHIAEFEADRAKLAEKLDEDLRVNYERLFVNKNGTAVVSLEHETCNGCHMKVTAQTAVRVKAENAIVNCEQCGRILYH